MWSLLLVIGCAPEPNEPGAADTAVSTDPLRAELQLALPLAEPERFYTKLGVDHDPEEQEAGLGQLQCLDYLGRAFPHCYDQHQGSDYLLEGGFEAMDAGSTEVIAAGDGVVSLVEDGHYDRCHGDLASGTNSCDGYEMIANRVELLHPTGHTTRYFHLREGSVAVEPGQEVLQGEVLGLVGSSGNSFAPHLHLQLEDADGVVIDPYAGPESQEETWWCDQGDEDDLPGPCA